MTAVTLDPADGARHPWGATAAIMMVGDAISEGAPTGPGLFAERPDLGYGVFMAMFVTYLMMAFTIFADVALCRR